MKKAERISSYLALGTIWVLLVACASQMEPAKQAIAGIENAVAAATPDASKYAPDQLAAVESKLTDLKTLFDQKGYAAVVARAPSVLAEAQNLASVAVAKKETAQKLLTDQWNPLAASIPPMMTEVQTRLEALAKAKRAPRGVDLAYARSSLTDASALWNKAQSNLKASDVQDALTAGLDAQAKLESAAMALKIQVAQTGTPKLIRH